MIRRTIQTGLFSLAALAMTATFALAQSHTSKPFAGAKVNATDNEGRTPLYWTRFGDEPELIDLLMKHGGKK